MFHAIKETLEFRSQAIQKMTPIRVSICRIVKDFLAHQYPTMIRGLVLEYNEKERILSLATPNKAFTQEISLNTKDIRAHLAVHKLRVRSIIVRSLEA